MVKVEAMDPIHVAPKRYSNIGVSLSPGDHAARVMDIERLATLDFWHQSGFFKSIKIDNLVKRSTGTDQLLTMSIADVHIDVHNDHAWKTGGIGGTQVGATVRHREIDYTLSYSYIGQVIDMSGSVNVPANFNDIPKDTVPAQTKW